ncbi:MAG: hypothetical protein WEB37_01410 [Bacteroidota bacterium]
MKRSIRTSIFAVLTFQASPAQGIQSFEFSTFPSARPYSNAVDVLTVSRDTVWVGTGKGPSVSIDGSSWHHYANAAGFGTRGVSAITIDDRIVWISSAYVERRDENFVQTGAGLHWSSDRGTTWTSLGQPVDAGTVDTLVYGINRIRALAVTVPQQNITYDIALTADAVWIASWAGGLRKSTDRGATWTRVILPPDNLDSIAPTDTLDFDLAPSGGALNLRPNYNHVAFSVHASDDTTLWVGTAAGINKSTDGGISWRRFSHQNLAQAISGNFVVALHEQRVGTEQILWAATVNAIDQSEYPAASYSTDGGTSWSVTLAGERVHNFASRDSIVYVASSRGVFRSSDRGISWLRSGSVYDETNNQRFVRQELYAVAAKGDTVWVGGSEGTAYTIDSPSQVFGASWRVFRAYEPVGNSPITYAFPLPFSPDDEVVRLHYGTGGLARSVTIRVYDFSMQPVKTLLQNAPRSGSQEHDEIWDGKDDRGNRVSNGVYFYRVEIEDKEPLWGKILVIK